MSTPSTAIYFIGLNELGEFGLGHQEEVESLTKCPNELFTNVFSGDYYNIFTDDELNELWYAGANYNFQSCIKGAPTLISSYTEITYFKTNNINVIKICINPNAATTFFITDTNKLYGCGVGIDDILEGREPVCIPDLEANDIIDIIPGYSYHIALCQDFSQNVIIIINHWARLHKLHQDIINLLIAYCKSTTVYATTKKLGPGHAEDIEFEHDNK